ncbi:MAG TPA: class I SAM-dependent methyltransferase [Bacillota bacterium]|nr:class I SAM-dependent methyltransferase [Bacillota bacterium]HOL12398.1 class I SAM-dependent methyltransferase [Bacillota bacterium]HPP61367.1 class I SAM-dependent methyltransferase [Bacillota bacterium]
MAHAEGNQYAGFFAEFYDIIHAGLGDVDGWIEFGHRFGPDILELGVGTGRIAIPLALAGFNVTGVDNSDDMIKRCQMKLSYEDERTRGRISIVKDDITCFDLNKQFDLIIAPCNVICHLWQPGKLHDTLSCVKEHLKSSGTFILENSLPDIPYMVRTNDIVQVFEFEHPLTGNTIVSRYKTRYDFLNQLKYDWIELEEYDDTGALLRDALCEDTMTYFFPRELRLMLDACGFFILEERGSLLEASPIGPESTEMVFVCRKVL